MCVCRVVRIGVDISDFSRNNILHLGEAFDDFSRLLPNQPAVDDFAPRSVSHVSLSGGSDKVNSTHTHARKSCFISLASNLLTIK